MVVGPGDACGPATLAADAVEVGAAVGAFAGEREGLGASVGPFPGSGTGLLLQTSVARAGIIKNQAALLRCPRIGERIFMTYRTPFLSRSSNRPPNAIGQLIFTLLSIAPKEIVFKHPPRGNGSAAFLPLLAGELRSQ